MGEFLTERPEKLSNPRADRVRRVRKLSGRSARSRYGRFLVEGPQAVREALRWAPGQVAEVYLAASAESRDPELAEAVRSFRWWPATSEVVDAMSPDAQGVLAVLDAPEAVAWSSVVGPSHRLRLGVLMAEVSDPGNAGTAIRVADAAGAGAVVLGAGSVELLNPKVVRSTAGSLFHVPVITDVGVEEAVTRLRDGGCQILAADVRGEWDLDDLADAVVLRGSGTNPARVPDRLPDLAAPSVWLMGHEARGLTDHQRALADAVVRIPVHGRAESLNLATALAVCLYASARAQRSAR